VHLGDFVKMWISHVSGHQSDPLPNVLGPSSASLYNALRISSGEVIQKGAGGAGHDFRTHLNNKQSCLELI
jgi:hypothetical protein